MITPIATQAERTHPLGLRPRGLLPNFYDVVVFFLIAGIFVALAHGAREMRAARKPRCPRSRSIPGAGYAS